MTAENDIVLIYFEDKPLLFAKIENISPDVKKGWYHVKLLILQVPLQVVTWILRDAYINGVEYTMGGKKMRMEKVVCPPDPEEHGIKEEENEENEENGETTGAKVISFIDRKQRGV